MNGEAAARTQTLQDAALECFACADPACKCALTLAAQTAFLDGRLSLANAAARRETPGAPGRPPRPALVPPREVPQRGLGGAEGRAALVHAVAHIEFNAINLAWDAVLRFAGMPPEYYRD